MMLTITLPEEIIPEIYDSLTADIISEMNPKRAIKVSDIKIMIKKAVNKSKGIKGKVKEFYDRKWIKKNLKRYA